MDQMKYTIHDVDHADMTKTKIAIMEFTDLNFTTQI